MRCCCAREAQPSSSCGVAKLALKSTSSNFALPKKKLELYPSHRPPKTTAHAYLRRVAGRARAHAVESIDHNRHEQHNSNQVTTTRASLPPHPRPRIRGCPGRAARRETQRARPKNGSQKHTPIPRVRARAGCPESRAAPRAYRFTLPARPRGSQAQGSHPRACPDRRRTTPTLTQAHTR